MGNIMKKRNTKEQQQVINHTGCVGLVSADAGTGKSATLIRKIAHNLNRSAEANKILVLMFGAAAKQNFFVRLDKELGGSAHGVSVKTIHAFGKQIIEEYYQNLGFEVYPKYIKTKDASAGVHYANQHFNPIEEQSHARINWTHWRHRA